MKVMMNIDGVQYSDNLVISYKVFDRRGNKILTRGCTSPKPLPECTCDICKHYDGVFCLYDQDNPFKVVNKYGICPYEEEIERELK